MQSAAEKGRVVGQTKREALKKSPQVGQTRMWRCSWCWKMMGTKWGMTAPAPENALEKDLGSGGAAYEVVQ